jgi:hypothetical protein
MRRLLLGFCLLGLVPASAAPTFPVKIKVETVGGGSLGGSVALVIVQDLDNHERDVVRILTDPDGNVPPLQLSPGIYRVIATTPYGIWQTSVHEFLVGNHATEVIVEVEAMWTHGYGDVIPIGLTRTRLQVFGPDGQPASGASILVRDRDATLYLERWYTADKKGTATIELVGEPTVVVVIYGDVLLTTEVAQNKLNPVIRFKKQ